MKHLLMLFMLLILQACSTGTTHVMKNAYERNFSQSEFDSICAVDSIDNDLSKWKQSAYFDAETHQNFTQYLFIKQDSVSQIIYRGQKCGDSIWLSKRITK